MNQIVRRNNTASQHQIVRHHLENLSSMDLGSFRHFVAPDGVAANRIRRWHRRAVRHEISALKSLNLTSEEAAVICQTQVLHRGARIPKRLARRWGAKPEELAAKLMLLTPHQRQAMQYAVSRFWRIWRQNTRNHYIFWNDRPKIDDTIAGALLGSGLTWGRESGSRSTV